MNKWSLRVVIHLLVTYRQSLLDFVQGYTDTALAAAAPEDWHGAMSPPAPALELPTNDSAAWARRLTFAGTKGTWTAGGSCDDTKQADSCQVKSATYLAYIITFSIHVGVELFLIYLEGFCYKHAITDRRPPWSTPVPAHAAMGPDGEFKYGLFSCFEDISYCLYGACCFSTRAVDTYSTTGILNFWPVLIGCFALFIFFACLDLTVAMATIDCGWWSSGVYECKPIVTTDTTGLAAAIVCSHFARKRQLLRRALSYQGPDKCFKDCCFYFWCSCCSVIQEARQVDEANGVRTDCCLKLAAAPGPKFRDVVGHPIGGE